MSGVNSKLNGNTFCIVTKYRMPEKIEPIRYVTVSDASGSTLSGSDLAQM